MKVLKGRLHKKVFLAMLAASLVPVAISGFMGLLSVYSSQTVSTARIEEGVLRQKAEEAQAFLLAISGVFEIRVGYGQKAPIADADQSFLLDKIVAGNSSIVGASFLNLEGKETARIEKGSSSPVLRDLSRLGWFSKIVKDGQTYVGPVIRTAAGPAVSVAGAVRNKNNDIVAIIYGRVSLSPLSDSFARANLGKSGYVYAIDRQGYIIGRDQQQIAVRRDILALPLIQKVFTGGSGVGTKEMMRYYSPLSASVVASSIPLRPIDMALVAEWPVDDADSILYTLMWEIAAFTGAALLLALMISAFVARRIVDPIRKLEAGTQLVAQGSFDVPIEITTGDELQELAESFTKMTAGLKELQQLKDEFVFIAAHELRTPVAAIKGYLQLVAEGFAGDTPAALREYIRKVTDANLRLVRLVDDLLEVARSDAGRLVIDVAPVPIAQSIQSVLSELAPLAAEKSIRIEYDPPADLPLVMADTGRVKEIVVNLVGNAIKYMGHDAGNIRITHEGGPGVLMTHIQDDGIGMSPDALSKLFQKFYRVATEKTRGITGTGLGLFIVKQIIEKMGGTITVASEEGKGSVFSFSLPVAAR